MQMATRKQESDPEGITVHKVNVEHASLSTMALRSRAEWDLPCCPAAVLVWREPWCYPQRGSAHSAAHFGLGEVGN